VRYVLAFFIPWLVFFTVKRPIAGIICLILQITLIGWLPATLWAMFSINSFNTDKKIQRALKQNQQ